MAIQAQPQESVREKRRLISDQRTTFSGRSSGTRSSPPFWRAVDSVGQKNQFCASAEPGGGGGGGTVICSVSSGILIESEAFQINPETPTPPPREGHVGEWGSQRGHVRSRRSLERAEHHVVPRLVPFSPLAWFSRPG